MRVQIVISGLLLDPGGDVGADFLIIRVLVDWPITNKVLVYLFKLLSCAAAVNREYSVSLVIAALLATSFVRLFADLWLMNQLHYLESDMQMN